MRVDDGKALGDVVTYLQAGFQGEQPVAFTGGAGGIEPGEDGYIDLDLAPGTYLVMCFLGDEATGKRHVELGHAQPSSPSPDGERPRPQPIDFWPSMVSRRMSAWPACWEVSATMCTNTRRADQLAPGSNHGASRQRVRQVEVDGGEHLVGAVGDLLVVGQDPGEGLALEHPEAVGVGVVGAAAWPPSPWCPRR